MILTGGHKLPPPAEFRYELPQALNAPLSAADECTLPACTVTAD